MLSGEEKDRPICKQTNRQTNKQIDKQTRLSVTILPLCQGRGRIPPNKLSIGMI